MIEPNDYSRHFFADFVALRIKAWDREWDGSAALGSPTSRGCSQPPRW